VNRRISAVFAQIIADNGYAEMALAAAFGPIRPGVSAGEFRDPFFE
jgi:hypothetical protein